MSAFKTGFESVLHWGESIPNEALFWTAALGVVATIDPVAPGGLNLCLFENLGLPCPGDGLGRAIAHLARGNWAASWKAHPLAGPVVVGLVYHILSLVRTSNPS